MRLLAIDPSINRCGIAIFDFGRLIHTQTLTTKALERRFKQKDMAEQIVQIVQDSVDHVAIENPFLRGMGNISMQRLIGSLEIVLGVPFTYYAPTSVKKFMGGGKMEKLDMALAAGPLLRSEEEQDLLASAISREAFDETDAVCIGLTFLQGGKS